MAELGLSPRQDVLDRRGLESGQLLYQRLAKHRGHYVGRLVTGRLLGDNAIDEPEPL